MRLTKWIVRAKSGTSFDRAIRRRMGITLGYGVSMECVVVSSV